MPQAAPHKRDLVLPKPALDAPKPQAKSIWCSVDEKRSNARTQNSDAAQFFIGAEARKSAAARFFSNAESPKCHVDVSNSAAPLPKPNAGLPGSNPAG
jgi:hypothetical protein